MKIQRGVLVAVCAISLSVTALLVAYGVWANAEQGGYAVPAATAQRADRLSMEQPGAPISFTTGLTFTDQTVVANVAVYHATHATSELNLMLAGAAAGDFNNDGWIDLFVISGGVTPDRLYINQANGTFSEQGAAWGVAVQHQGAGAAVGDYNNDGWLDIFVTSHGLVEVGAVGHHRLYRNNKNGSFTNVARASGVNLTSSASPDGFGAAFGDYDLDGDLDLFVAGWQPTEKNNRLFRNNGDGTFADVTASAVVLAASLRGFSPCFVDMDGDRYPELLVAGDFNSTKYLVNNRDGTFTDQSEAAGVKLPAYGMGSTVADLNNDGQLDWYITAIYKASFGGEGNRLFINQGNHRFVEQGAAARVEDGRWGWGTAAVDLNHDGWLDLVETNGWPLEVQFQQQPARVWINQRTGQFSEAASAVGLNYTRDGRGLLNFDYDNDGDQDIVITSNNDQLALFRNELAGAAANWLRIFLDTRLSPDLAPNGIGAQVAVRIGAVTYQRTIQACSNYLSQSEMSAHFGLGPATVVDEVRVTWPNGTVTALQQVTANQTIKLLSVQTIYLPLISH